VSENQKETKKRKKEKRTYSNDTITRGTESKSGGDPTVLEAALKNKGRRMMARKQSKKQGGKNAIPCGARRPSRTRSKRRE
jgi:hypothetical protein